MADTPRSSSSSRTSSLAYRTGFYVGALRGYQTVSEVSSVEGPDFCQGFADGLEIVMRWLKHYVSDGGTFDGALGDLMPYFPRLRAWVGDARSQPSAQPVQPPSRRERRWRSWERAVADALSEAGWQTTKEVFGRLGGRGPRSLNTLNRVLQAMASSGRVEQLQEIDLTNGRPGVVRWRWPVDQQMTAAGH